jgi:N-methylhydantoinase B
LNTPIEALEYAYPFRVRSYGCRKGSGGKGKFRGGDGLVREIELLAPSQVTFLCERHKFAPYGLAGGEDGAQGRIMLEKANGETTQLPAKCTLYAATHDVIHVETPGGGGWGKPGV